MKGFSFAGLPSNASTRIHCESDVGQSRTGSGRGRATDWELLDEPVVGTHGLPASLSLYRRGSRVLQLPAAKASSSSETCSSDGAVENEEGKTRVAGWPRDGRSTVWRCQIDGIRPDTLLEWRGGGVVSEGRGWMETRRPANCCFRALPPPTHCHSPSARTELVA